MFARWGHIPLHVPQCIVAPVRDAASLRAVRMATMGSLDDGTAAEPSALWTIMYPKWNRCSGGRAARQSSVTQFTF